MHLSNLVVHTCKVAPLVSHCNGIIFLLYPCEAMIEDAFSEKRASKTGKAFKVVSIISSVPESDEQKQ